MKNGEQNDEKTESPISIYIYQNKKQQSSRFFYDHCNGSWFSNCLLVAFTINETNIFQFTLNQQQKKKKRKRTQRKKKQNNLFLRETLETLFERGKINYG